MCCSAIMLRQAWPRAVTSSLPHSSSLLLAWLHMVSIRLTLCLSLIWTSLAPPVRYILPLHMNYATLWIHLWICVCRMMITSLASLLQPQLWHWRHVMCWVGYEGWMSARYLPFQVIDFYMPPYHTLSLPQPCDSVLVHRISLALKRNIRYHKDRISDLTWEKSREKRKVTTRCCCCCVVYVEKRLPHQQLSYFTFFLFGSNIIPLQSIQ